MGLGVTKLAMRASTSILLPRGVFVAGGVFGALDAGGVVVFGALDDAVFGALDCGALDLGALELRRLSL